MIEYITVSVCLNELVVTKPSVGAAPTPDARRQGGDRTRRRLVEAAQVLIAERGEAGVRLRELAELAQANVAAVTYHFGSLGALLLTATTDAVERIIDAQVHELDALPADANLQEIAAAYFRPMIEVLNGPSSKGRDYVRVLARATTDSPTERQDWVDTATARAHHALIARLNTVLPGVSDEQLLFRVKCVGGILVLLSTVAFAPDLYGKSVADVEQMLAPIVAGTLATA